MEPPQNEENQPSSESKQNYQPLNAEDIKRENILRLNKNAEKLRELEAQMTSIEKLIEEIKLKQTKNKIDEKISKEETGRGRAQAQDRGIQREKETGSRGAQAQGRGRA